MPPGLLQTGVRVKIVQIGAILLLPSNHFGARDCRSLVANAVLLLGSITLSVSVSQASKQVCVCCCCSRSGKQEHAIESDRLETTWVLCTSWDINDGHGALARVVTDARAIGVGCVFLIDIYI